MAVSAGISGIGVDWGYHPVESLREAGASRIISAMQDLLNLQDLLALRA
jgi:phosphoglycolate phosphatase-like HAD superfamily hydrolase